MCRKCSLSVVLTLELLNLHERLVSVLLCLVHVPSLHAVHHRHQVHQHVQVLLWHPYEHVPNVWTTHTSKITFYFSINLQYSESKILQASLLSYVCTSITSQNNSPFFIHALQFRN